MLKRERQAYILQQLNLHNSVLSSLLSSAINVSEDTIRRDLQELAKEGKVIKVHGGALSLSYHSPNDLPVVTTEETAPEKTIALKAVTLLKNNMFVLSSGGATVVELARNLPPQLSATFISGSIATAMACLQHASVEVILIGDKISKKSAHTTGGEAIARIKQLKTDCCFVDVQAIDLQYGITENDWEVAQIKKAMLESARKVIGLTTAANLNTIKPIHVAETHKLHYLITELPADDALLRPYANMGIQVL